jgi:hypothetical protein
MEAGIRSPRGARPDLSKLPCCGLATSRPRCCQVLLCSETFLECYGARTTRPLICPKVCTVCYDEPRRTVRRRNPLRLAACSCIFWPSDELETWFCCDIPGITKTAEYIQCNFAFLRTKTKGTAYVQKCRSCRMNELSHHAKSGEV